MPTTSEYIFDVIQHEEERRQFVYSCAECSGVLAVRKRLDSPGDILDSLSGICSACGAKLESSLECRLGRAPENWREIAQPIHRTHTRRRTLFQRATSYNRFSLDFMQLDRLIQPLRPENLVMLEGPCSSEVAELISFRAQMPPERGGLDSTTLFIDGGNRSDPYLFASLARRYSIDTKVALRRVKNCRVFTTYQLASVLSSNLLETAETQGSKLVVVANLLGTFTEPEMSEKEAERLLEAIHQGLAVAKRKLTVVVTLDSHHRHSDRVAPWADTLIRFSPSRGARISAELLQHPTNRPTRCEFSLKELLYHPDSPLELVH